MKIKAGPEQFHAHRAALDVPAGAALAPGTGPKHIAILRHARFPESEVGHGFLLIFVAAHALADAHFVKIQVHQLPILAAGSTILLDAEINRTIGGFVSLPTAPALYRPRNSFCT